MQEAKSLSNEEEATQSYLLGGTAIGKKHSVLFKNEHHFDANTNT